MPLHEIKRLCRLQGDALEAEDWDLVERIEDEKREILRLNFQPNSPKGPLEAETLMDVFELCNSLKNQVQAEMERARGLLMTIRPRFNTFKDPKTALYVFQDV